MSSQMNAVSKVDLKHAFLVQGVLEIKKKKSQTDPSKTVRP